LYSGLTEARKLELRRSRQYASFARHERYGDSSSCHDISPVNRLPTTVIVVAVRARRTVAVCGRSTCQRVRSGDIRIDYDRMWHRLHGRPLVRWVQLRRGNCVWRHVSAVLLASEEILQRDQLSVSPGRVALAC